jgi:hypothetical protein
MTEVLDGNITVGTIVAFYGEIPNKLKRINEHLKENGWLLCDGTQIPNNYKLLIKLVGERTPNLQGYFLRGSDTTNDIDHGYTKRSGEGQKIGSIQGDAFEDHKHYRNEYNSEEQIRTDLKPKIDGTEPHNMHQTLDQSGYTMTGLATYGSIHENETRPKNVYINWIIKAK